MNENDLNHFSGLSGLRPRTLSLTELHFVARAIADAMHILTVTTGMRVTESGVGEVVEEATSHVMDNYDQVAALHLAEHLLGASKKPPTPLPQILGMRAAIEATGDARALELFERWQQLRRG
jgi:hypothetical protein